MILETSAMSLALSKVATAQAGAEAIWMWSGNIAATTATVRVKVRGIPQDLHLLVGPNADWRQARRISPSAPVAQDTGNVATFSIDDLQPNTQYFYAPEEGERRLATTGEFRTYTDGPMSFRFAFASCAGGGWPRSISNHEIFSIIEARRPHFMLHMGDFHYRNIPDNDIRKFRDAYESVLTKSRQASLFRRTPIVYMWDDHDFGEDDSDRESPSRPSARRAYVEHVPHYPLALQDGAVTTIQQEFTVGRVRFIVSDLRSERDPWQQPDGEGKSMLGPAQRDWLAGAFTRAANDKVPLVLWVSSVPWITRSTDGSDGWQPYDWERRWLADRLASVGLMQRIVMLSGDAHMVAIDNGSNNNHGGFPVVHAAPLDRGESRKGGPYSHGVSERNHQFGWADVQDDGTTLRATFSGHDQSGGPIQGMRLQVACRDGVCTIVT